MNYLVHQLAGNCEHCGDIRILSTWTVEELYFFVFTCVTCDAPSPDEPFAE